MPQADPHNLERFLAAQSADYPRALDELRTGRKESHWIWYIFPQVAGLGHSAMAKKYALGSRAECLAYLHHPILGRRLLECCEALLQHPNARIQDIMDFPDDVKLRSSVTAFALLCPSGSLFHQVLEAFYDGRMDKLTAAFLEPPALF